MSRTATMTTPNLHQAGIKRRADDTLDDEQRFAKRFNLLNIGRPPPPPSPPRKPQLNSPVDHPSKLYIPVSTNSPAPTTTTAPPPSAPTSEPDAMPIDDTPHRIYIHDLDAEVASCSPPSEPQLVFLPDIERHFARIPSHILRGAGAATDNSGKELVLYETPGAEGGRSQEQDLVRRAMEETRRRKREEWGRRARQTWKGEGTETAHGFGGEDWGDGVGEEGRDEGAEARVMGWGEIRDREEGEEEDGDAMDIG
ncbi:hypothetical protein C1H76_0476 [Elsinoe australis]|uniref:Uncharacterized protein n=1 Tax=Elsinoe australis TaxID=40998 RepID=A0A4V6DV73_9PEZI|nr:hypothetical protein C1H76_0476 [Elsinoe australis]